MLHRFKSIYTFSYDKENDLIYVGIANTARKTPHKANEKFSINATKVLGRKIVFDIDSINIWKDFQLDKRLSIYSLLDVHNAVSKLKVMYQVPDKKKVIDVLQNFDGIKRL